MEKDPLGKQASDPGAKLDDGKLMADVLLEFSRSLRAVAEVGTYGIKKYSRGGWYQVPDGYQRYTGAMMRHILDAQEKDYDEDSGLLHDAQIAWNALARLDMRLRKYPYLWIKREDECGDAEEIKIREVPKTEWRKWLKNKK